MNINYITKFILISAIFLVADICISQNTSFKDVLKSFKTNDYENINKNLKKIDTSSISKYDKATWLFYDADYNFRIDKHHKAYESIIKSKKLFYSIQKFDDAIDCNILLLAILGHQNNLNINTEAIISETEKYAKEKKDSTALRNVYRRIATKYIHLGNGEKAIEYFKKIIPIALKQKDSIRIGYCYDNIGTAFKHTKPIRIDSSIYYKKKATAFYIKYKDYISLAYNYNNQGEYYKQTRNYNLALKYYKKADSITLSKHVAKSKLIFYQNIAGTYDKLNDYKNETKYLKKIANLKDSINDTKQNIAISDIKEKYDNEKLRADNLAIEAKRIKNKNFLIGSLLFILLAGTIGVLSLKNSKRKRKLAEQEKELETQKNLNLLKEQELTTINAMVDGQEKERKRIAEDLHDNLGSVLATLKLHFENLKINREKKKINQETLFDKTEGLIDEAYLKVRSIAHAKNAGVIANQGLLTAIKMMAEKISSADKIKIEVIDFGLDKRLENSLEITVFRIIQELITNTLKHAEAKNATINISLYDKNLNIIIEDDGKGFDINKVNLKNGMGISSIKTRVNHLGGTFNVDSTKGKGSSIIIDLPIL
ncbi:sensor histidine kinase [Polaribacter sp. Hel1_85]|uniref:tetratricopeptide repeat-containing sensor histidine kinase n=1 Tax=Polaribacter sp. Hel1_85 TaxID=1250005 RepID=UPI00052D4EC3|nr:sensor histidine kinase [Polaribacter sp. Hel1_85]KGL63265.1 two-component system sensor histidine kinase [Polaribacter sp. Hel1_85]